MEIAFEVFAGMSLALRVAPPRNHVKTIGFSTDCTLGFLLDRHDLRRSEQSMEQTSGTINTVPYLHTQSPAGLLSEGFRT